MLHDVSHTAFSHAVNFVISTQEQDHHEQLKPMMLERPDIVAALKRLGYSPREFYDDSIYPLLEQPLPSLCADRLDYFFRDGLACGVVTSEAVERILGDLAIRDDRIIMTEISIAREAVSLYELMNRDWWAGPIEAFIYNEFADALREGMRLGILRPDDLMTEDDLVLAKLDSAAKPEHRSHARPDPTLPSRDGRRIFPSGRSKERWIDPLVRTDGGVERLSVLDDHR